MLRTLPLVIAAVLLITRTNDRISLSKVIRERSSRTSAIYLVRRYPPLTPSVPRADPKIPSKQRVFRAASRPGNRGTRHCRDGDCARTCGTAPSKCQPPGSCPRAECENPRQTSPPIANRAPEPSRLNTSPGIEAARPDDLGAGASRQPDPSCPSTPEPPNEGYPALKRPVREKIPLRCRHFLLTAPGFAATALTLAAHSSPHTPTPPPEKRPAPGLLVADFVATRSLSAAHRSAPEPP